MTINPCPFYFQPAAGDSPICTAIVQELCDCGSLADVLMDRSFPATRRLQPASANTGGRGRPVATPGAGVAVVAMSAVGPSRSSIDRSASSGRVEIDMKVQYPYGVLTKLPSVRALAGPYGHDGLIPES